MGGVSGGGLGMMGAGNTTPPESIAAEAGRAREAGAQFGIALLACPEVLNAERLLRGWG